MATIALEGMQFYAYHGFYEEEQIIGNYYLVDIEVQAPIGKAGKSDILADTLNYETLYLIVEKEMQKPAKLLEAVIERIIQAVTFQFPNVEAISVTLKKKNPPLDGLVAASVVKESLNFKIACARCKKSLICYRNENCWCTQKNKISVASLEKIKEQFGGACLCNDCLDLYI